MGCSVALWERGSPEAPRGDAACNHIAHKMLKLRASRNPRGAVLDDNLRSHYEESRYTPQSRQRAVSVCVIPASAIAAMNKVGCDKSPRRRGCEQCQSTSLRISAPNPDPPPRRKFAPDWLNSAAARRPRKQPRNRLRVRRRSRSQQSFRSRRSLLHSRGGDFYCCDGRAALTFCRRLRDAVSGEPAGLART